MATADQLLSTKNQDKMNKIKKNPEDQEPKEVGGPQPEWSTANYANFSFDAVQGVKSDTTIPKAHAAEAMPKLKTVKEEDEKDDEKDEKEDLKEELPVDDDYEEDEEEVPAEDDDSLDIDLDDLLKDETDSDVIDLGGDDTDETADDLPMDGESEDDADMLTTGDDEEMSSADEAEPLPEPVEGEDEDTEEMPEFELTDDDSEDTDDESDDEEAEEAEESEDEEESEESEDDDEKLDEESDEEEESEEDEEEEKKKKVDEGKKPFAEKMPKIKQPKSKGLKENKIRVKFNIAESKKLFKGNTTLTEEDVRQSRVLFESAVRSVAKQMGKTINEAYQQRYAKFKKMHEAKTSKQLDAYLSYVVEQWAKDNKVALQNQLRNRLTENFLRGLKNLFVEHYIEVPESKVNVVESLARNVKSLKTQLQEAEARTVALHKEMRQSVTRERKALVKEHKAKLIAEAAAVLAPVDRGAFKTQAENMKFANTKNFKKDLVALREQYLGTTQKPVERSARMSDAAPLFEEKKAVKNTAMDSYLRSAGKLSGN